MPASDRRKFRAPLALALALLTGACASVPDGVTPRRELFDEVRANPRISPDGTRLAYVESRGSDGKLVVEDLEGGRRREYPYHRWSESWGGIVQFQWGFDNQGLLFPRDHAGREDTHLQRLDLASGKLLDYTPFPGAAAELVAASPRKPGEILVGVNARDRHVFDLYRVDIASRKTTLDTRNPGDVSTWICDLDLRARAAIARHAEGGFELRFRDDPSSAWRTVASWPGPTPPADGAWFDASGTRVRLIAGDGLGPAALWEIDIRTGARRILARDPRFDLDGIVFDGANEPEAVFSEALRPTYTPQPGFGARFAPLAARWPDGGYRISSRDLADRTWIVRAERQSYLYHPETGELRPWHPPFPRPLARSEPISFAARDGLTLFGYWSPPLSPPPRGLPPLVLLVHGGPWARDTLGPDAESQWLASRGYSVLRVNFRGSTGFGPAYFEAGRHEWGGRMTDDLIDAERWAIASGRAEAGRTCIYGGSYGGFAVLSALTRYPDAFRCGIANAGVSDLAALLKDAPASWQLESPFLRAWVGDPVGEAAFVRERSPIFAADRIRSPLLIIHGENDPRTHLDQSTRMADAMRAHGRPVELLVLKDSGHWAPYTVYYRMKRFLAEHLGGEVEPPGAEDLLQDRSAH